MHRRYFESKIQLIDQLMNHPTISVDYNDICVLVSAILSSCSAFRWPGRQIDRSRFIEMLIMHTDRRFKLTYVSEYALLNDGLITKSQMGLSDFIDVGIYTDNDVDLELAQAALKYGHIKTQKLKNYTYAAIIYDHIRCGYLHTYSTGGSLGTVPASQRPAFVDYILRKTTDGIIKIMCFRIDYLIEIAKHHVKALPDESQESPKIWWIKNADAR